MSEAKKSHPTFVFDVRVGCNRCGTLALAQLNERELVLVDPRNGQPFVKKHRWVDLPAGWAPLPVLPGGPPVTDRDGATTVDLQFDPPERVAQASQCQQPGFACGSCSSDAALGAKRAIDVVRSAGVTVLGPDGRPIQ